jgi:hypothetical protein
MLIREVVRNELRAEDQDQSHWMFRLDTDNKNGQKNVDEVIETKAGDLKHPILINGRELTPQERQQVDRQLGRDTQALRRTLKDKNEDAARSKRLLTMLPEAFTFSYGQRHGDRTQLTFKPSPGFHPNSHEAEVFHAMEGHVWVDEKQNRLAEISGRLIEPIKFGGGFLGHLNKGGTFDVKQEEVAPGYWEMTVLNVEMNGKAFFFKTISVHQKYSRSEFKRVPDNLTVDQAADMLRKLSQPRSQNAPSGCPLWPSKNNSSDECQSHFPET